MSSDEFVKKILEAKKPMRFDEVDDEEPEDYSDDLDISDTADTEDDNESPEEDMEDDDSQAPPRGDDKSPRIRPRHTSSPKSPEHKDPEEEPESEEKEKDLDEPKTPSNVYENPLDNLYAVQHTIGDEISIVLSKDANSALHGTIDGYDPEGFYRIRWDDGSTTNGFTDITLAAAMKKTNESKCVCGHNKFVVEDNYLVCDRCGRRIRENKTLDTLTIADKSRPKGKRMIRSEAHPVSTAIRPNISETIRAAMKSKKKTLREDIGDDPFESLHQLEGDFWTRIAELVEDVEELGYTVVESNSEYIVVAYYDIDEDDTVELQIPLGGTSRTVTLDFTRAYRI